MKTSQNLNKIISKLPKTELKGEKVELSVVGDISKLSKEITSQIKKTEQEKIKLKEANDRALDVREQGVDVFDRAMFIREEAKDGAKTLGVEVNDIKGFKEFDDNIDVLQKEFQSLLKMVK